MARVWISGAETGDINESATPGGSVTVSTANPRTGAYHYRGTSTNAFFDFPAYSNGTMFYRFYSYILANPAANNTFFQLVNGATGLLTLQLNSTGKVVLILGSSAGVVKATSTNSITLNAYIRFEVKIICGTASNGTLETKFYDASENLVETLTSTAQTTGAATVAGAGWGFRTAAQQIDNDDIVTDTAAYPGPGQVIARQPKTGAPTNDVWTKAGADPYWADTPFSTTTAATSTNAANSRQSKLVSAFTATQAGHGNQVISVRDTVNAFQTVFVAKRGAGTAATYGFGYILNGALTETAVVLTTADAYYIGSIVATPALWQMNKMEVGGKQTTASAVFMTIEDAWVMVDYTVNNTDGNSSMSLNKPKARLPEISWNNPLTRGLAFDMPFIENGGTSLEEIVAKQTGTSSSLTNNTWRKSRFGPYMEFNNTSNNVKGNMVGTIAAAGSPGTYGNSLINFSVETYVRCNLNLGGAEFFSKGAFGSFGGYWGLREDVNTNSWCFEEGWATNNPGWGSVNGSLVVGQWTHLVVTMTAMNLTTSKPSFYVNGTLNVSASFGVYAFAVQPTTGTQVADTAAYTIGSYANNSGSFMGDIAYIRIWNRVLNGKEVATLYQNPWCIYKQPNFYQPLNFVLPPRYGFVNYQNPGVL